MNRPPPVVDSHIHLYAAHHITSLNWTAQLPKDHVLNRGYTVADYRAATAGIVNLKGFVFIETDRKSGLGEGEWQDSLDEVAFLARIAEGRPPPPGVPDEGYGPADEDGNLVLGVVPWAPLPAGREAVRKFVDRALASFSPEQRRLIKGFRYLLQDKPRGLVLQPAFLDSLRWLGEHGYTFDLGVDARSAGLHQLDEACQMMEILYGSTAGSGMKMVINHLCKPNLRITADGHHPDFVLWKGYIEKMAGYPNAYMKLSGLFSELPPQDEAAPVSSLLTQVAPWAAVVFAAFTPSRIMFGSDWPVCNVGGPGVARSWSHYHALVTSLIDHLGLGAEEQALVWSGTAIEAYGIQHTLD